MGEVLVGVGSVKGSPGVTTLALGLASVWPGQSVLLVEADPSGGDVGLWRGVGSSPGLVSLAGAARRGRPGGVDVLDHARELGSGLWVVPGPAGSEQAKASILLLADRAGLLREAGERFDAVILDLGRLDPASPTQGLLPVVDVLLLAARGTVAELTHLASAPPELTYAVGEARTGVVLTQGCRFRTREVEEALGVPLLAVLPSDAATATMLSGAPAGAGRRGWSWRRTGALLIALGDLASHLVQVVTPRERPTGRAAVEGSPERPAVKGSPERPQLPAGGRRAPESTPRAVPSRATTGPVRQPSAARPAPDVRPTPGSSPDRGAVPRSAKEAGWTRATAAEPPGTARPARRRTS